MFRMFQNLSCQLHPKFWLWKLTSPMFDGQVLNEGYLHLGQRLKVITMFAEISMSYLLLLFPDKMGFIFKSYLLF